eukprot:TRINITY_DN27803_c0_g1_i1.p2 TRINITY_DN27803_c0_g1~~TRINITY_DN27803_c0_g1_i1.p2  ORF type:complete len:154 (+),score=55.25 TRINITY_DN27803_c0_g1_i1:48-509(+)
MTSCRFADGRNAECGAWKERVHLEEKSARAMHQRANNPNQSYKSVGVWSMGYDEMKSGPPNRGSPGAQASYASPTHPTTASSAVTGSYYSGSARSSTKRMHEVTKRLTELEASLEDEKTSRSEVQTELKELRQLLKQFVGQEKGSVVSTEASR